MRQWAFVGLLLLSVFALSGVLHADVRTINTFPNSVSPPADWPSQMNTFLGREAANRDTRARQPYVYSGGICTAGCTGGASHTIDALVGEVNGFPLNEPATVRTYGVTSGRVYVFAHSDDTTPATFDILAGTGTGCTFPANGRVGRLLFVNCAASSGEPILLNGGTSTRAVVLPLQYINTDGAQNITAIQSMRPSNPQRTNWINVRDPVIGAMGDGTTDDRAAIARGTAIIARRGGVLYFPCGTYVGNSASALVSLITASFSGVQVIGASETCTTLRQDGIGHGIELLDSTSLGGVRIAHMTLLGSNTAAKAIDTNNWQGGVIEHVLIDGFLNDAIDIRGASNYNNTVKHARITAGIGALTTARAVRFDAGNNNSVEHTYFNIGGAGLRYETCLSANGVGGALSLRNFYDGCATGIRTNTAFTSIHDTFDTSAALTVAYVQSVNNILNIIGARVSTGTLSSRINFLGNDRRYLSIMGWGTDPERVVRGGVLQSATISPPQIITTTNDYAPSGSQDASIWRLSTNGDQNITGIQFGTPGKIILVINVGSQPITLLHNSALSAFGNRFQSPRTLNESLWTGEQASLVYDGDVGVGVWRIFRSFVPYHPTEAISPGQITADQNNYPTPGSSTFRRVSLLRLNTDAARTVTGFDVASFMHPSGESGYLLRIINVGSFNLVLANQDVLSVAANRIITGTGAGVTLTPDQAVTLMYDTTTARWRIVARNF